MGQSNSLFCHLFCPQTHPKTHTFRKVHREWKWFDKTYDDESDETNKMHSYKGLALILQVKTLYYKTGAFSHSFGISTPLLAVGIE